MSKKIVKKIKHTFCFHNTLWHLTNCKKTFLKPFPGTTKKNTNKNLYYFLPLIQDLKVQGIFIDRQRFKKHLLTNTYRTLMRYLLRNIFKKHLFKYVSLVSYVILCKYFKNCISQGKQVRENL